MIRQIDHIVREDLAKKMVFISGPRQAGKTWLSKKIMEHVPQSLYLNWDNLDHRQIILSRTWSTKVELLVFDEIHKMKSWKLYLKGLWDSRPTQLTILVTGSVRLEIFRQSGDSLAGRFFHHRLLPITPEEATWAQVPPNERDFFDLPLVRDPGARLENLVALSLLRRKYFLEDTDGIPRSLHYLRTKDGREVDFLWVKDLTPERMIEVKSSDSQISKHLVYFNSLYQIPGTQLVDDLGLECFGPIEVRALYPWLQNLEVYGCLELDLLTRSHQLARNL